MSARLRAGCSGVQPRHVRRCCGSGARVVTLDAPTAARAAGRGRTSRPRRRRATHGDTMFDGRWRSTFEKGLRPIGAQIRRTGITANHLTTTGLVMAVAAAVAIANGSLRAGLLLLVLTAVPDVLDGAVAKASGTASPRGAFFDSVVDRVTDALLLGGVAWYLASTQPGRVAVLPLAVLGGVDARLLRAGQGRVARLRRPRRPHGAGRAPRRSSAFGLLFESLLVPVLWVMLVLTVVHRRPAVREGVAPGVGAPGPAARAPAGGPAGWPARRSAPGAASRWHTAAGGDRRPPAVTPARSPTVPMDLVTPAYRAASLRGPEPARAASSTRPPHGWPGCWRAGGGDRRDDGRAPPAPGRPPASSGAALRRRVQQVFASYGRYWRVVPAAGHRPRRARRPA